MGTELEAKKPKRLYFIECLGDILHRSFNWKIRRKELSLPKEWSDVITAAWVLRIPIQCHSLHVKVRQFPLQSNLDMHFVYRIFEITVNR